MTKISMFVGFPASIDLSPYLHRDADKELRKDATFELYGVVSHSGSLNSGHYVAYARDPSVKKPSLPGLGYRVEGRLRSGPLGEETFPRWFGV